LKWGIFQLGWRCLIDAKMSGELTRLSSENAELRNQLKKYRIEEKQEQLKEMDKIMDLMEQTTTLHVWYKDASAYKEYEKKKTLTQVFLTLAPEMLVEKSLADLSRYAAQILCNVDPNDFRWEFPVPQNLVKSWMADFLALGLAKPSSKKKPVSDRNEYWSITQKGQEYLNAARRVYLERVWKEEKKIN
jgi:hypothetical protein